jgi:sulfur carrier protein ThiS
MKVTLKLLVDYQKYLPPGSKNGAVDFDVPQGTHAADLLAFLAIPPETSNVFLINGHTATEDDELQEGDIVFVFAAMAGG